MAIFYSRAGIYVISGIILLVYYFRTIQFYLLLLDYMYQGGG